MLAWYWPLIATTALFVSLLVGYYLLVFGSVLQTVDRYSAANFQFLRSTHYNLDLTIDFKTNTMYGSVTHYLKSIASGIGVAVLDTRDIDISKVYDVQAKKELSWAVYPFEYITGMKNEQLVITLDHATRYNEVLEIRIEYKTSPDATAVNWVPENQTLSGDLKYMYTQCEAIQCRSIVPIQDSPAVKSTFNATLRVEAPYVAIASALLVNKTEIARRDGSGKVVVYKYAQSIPVPSYLLALVAGHIGFQMSGRRAGVYAEPAILEKSVNELSEMDAFMSILENVLIPYAWGVYNVVIMPPSFPFGGMENPYLTFVSPSIIIGDRSSAYVVAHEIGHSWFGNQLTCKNWSHFWLNEGFTRYAERLVIRKLYGENRFTCQCRIGMYELRDLVESFISQGRGECTKLFPNLYHEGPDDIMSTIAYEKGFLFLVFVEGLMGTDNFYDFLRAYLSTLSYRSVDVWEMKDTLESYVQSYLPTNSTKILEKIDWNMWLFEVGMPRNVNTEFINPQIQSALNLANYYVDHQESPANKSEYKSYILDLRIIFMKQLIGRLDTLTDKALRLIDSDFNVTQSEANPEVLVPWLRLMISKRCFEANGRAKLFLSGIGRQKYLVPIYTAYAQADKATGLKYYNEFRYKYHPIAQRRIDLIFAAAESE